MTSSTDPSSTNATDLRSEHPSPRARRIRRLAVRASLALAASGAFFAAAGQAFACGGCFVSQSTPTVVSGHRMVLSVSTTQSVLWDQIQYAGDPTEFAWILPVKPGARIESSTSAFFEVLEATTRLTITAPPVNCGNSGGGLGCGAQALSSGSEDSTGTGGGAPTVTVVHQSTVGPYETVTLQTKTPGALNEWLSMHGYDVDPSTQPIIDSYVAEGFDFIALRLQPGKGTSVMTPVRVVQQGASPALPLRMVGIGTGAEVPIVLFVVGEGRWATQNFPEARVESSLLSWDFKTQQSNYEKLRKDALAAGGGRGWLTAFSQQGVLTAPVFTSNNNFTGNAGLSFAQTYADQAFSNQETKASCKLPVLPQSANGIVENPCPAGEPPNSGKCGTVAPGHVDSRTLGCEGADDVATALTGMHLSDVWVTRLEANLPHSALDTDLLLQAASKQVEVANGLQATIAIHPEALCSPPAPAGAIVLFPRLHKPGQPPANGLALGGFFGLTLAAMGIGLVARRALSKPRPT